MFSFKRKNTDEVLNHWISFAEEFNLAPLEFYAGFEKKLTATKIPGLESSRVEYSEGGLLSDKRIYLRFIRERLAFDICAAPFGKQFFFSCRSVHSPPVVRLWHIMAVLSFFGLLYYPLIRLLGFTSATVAIFALPLAFAQVLRNTVAMGLADLDRLLLKIPALGPIYERFFRADTYFREDTRLLYLEAVPTLLKQFVAEVTGEKGIKLVRQYERAPVLGELYKPVLPVTVP